MHCCAAMQRLPQWETPERAWGSNRKGVYRCGSRDKGPEHSQIKARQKPGEPHRSPGEESYRGLVLGRQPRVDDDMAPFKADVLTDGEILEDACHHLTGGANTVGDILLGQLFGDVEGAVTALL